MIKNRKWWKEGVVYQIYPRSFQDTNGDGIGDLAGITRRLDYIQGLGVDIIWLNPIYTSPNDDNGYDISDYRNIMKEFGTMADFDELLSEMKSRNLRLIMDLVVNHTSDEHPWFLASRASRAYPFREFYHWWGAEKGHPPKRFSYFDPEGNAWKYDAPTDAYYLHYFSEKQPDLNWESTEMRNEIYKMMAFWFEKGVDGFRMDVISFISKDPGYPELPERYNGNFLPFYASGPRLHEYLQEMNRKVLSRYEVMSVGEAPGVTLEGALEFVDEERRELNMFFQFDLMALDREENDLFITPRDDWKLTDFKNIFSKWDAVFSKKGWGSLYLDNHDFPRAVSRWGNDSEKHWRHSATMLQTLLLTMRGTPYIYYGGEIGMTNAYFESLDDYRDINTLKNLRAVRDTGGDVSARLQLEMRTSRDNARTPMQWDTSENAGFTSGIPWIPVNPNYGRGINVAQQETLPHSVLNYFRRLVALRKSHPVLVYGQYRVLLPENEEVYTYLRTYGKKRLLVLLSFSERVAQVRLSCRFREARLLLTNNIKGPTRRKSNRLFRLGPYHAYVYELH